MKSTIVQSLFSLLSPAGPRGRLSVLMFHKIPTVADPLTTGEMDLARFEHILDFLVDNANVMPLPEATAALQAGKLPKRAMALTFDDGYAEWIDNVSPALRKRSLPGTFFVTTGQLSGSALWHERIVAAVRALPDHGVALPYGFGNYTDLSLPGSRLRLVEELQERLKYAPLADRAGAIEVLEKQARSAIALPPPFDAESVRTLHNQGFDIGAHTVHHPILNECTQTQARAEIGGSKEELEAIIGGRVHSFAYPNGRPNEDYSHTHVEMVKACGYTSAVTTSNGVSTRTSDIFQLPRFTPWGVSDERIAFQLARNMCTSPTPLTATAGAHTGRDDHARTTDVRCLLIASTFPPIHGGSAVVYDNLCQFMPAGSIRVLTAKKNYLNDAPVEGWQEHDAAAPYPVDRADFLRPRVLPPPANVLVSAGRLLFQDFPLYAKALLAAARIVREHDINVVCIGELVTGSWLGMALRKLYKVKVVIYVHGEEITTVTGGRLSGNKRKDYLQAADKIVAVSSFTCDALSSLMDVKPESIVLIQNGVDTGRFTPGPRNPALIARHGLAGKKVVVTVGRMVARKGVDKAVLAMAQVLRHRQDVHYLVLGDGELRPEVERIIAAEGLGAHVTLVGKVSDSELVDYLRLSDLFLMPNRTMPDGDTEGFGLVFREANACRKPVIGGRAGGVVEAVVENVSGLLVDGNNVAEIAAAIERILGDDALAERLSANGLQLALDNNTAAVARQFVKTCERVLSESAY
jgi:glycosyltransferase involved in cell wall biosynthesis/peptidoglycan/xylan/chitin deacetylase (PgdA/CDA1 family)